MWTELIAGAVGGVIGAGLRPSVDRLLPSPGRRRSVQLRVERLETDHEIWVERNEREMGRALRQVEDNMLLRGIIGSSIQVHEERRVRQEFTDALKDHKRETLRGQEDAMHELGPIERLITRFKTRGGRRVTPASIENQLFPPD